MSEAGNYKMSIVKSPLSVKTILLKSPIAIVLVIGFQLIVYLLFFHPNIIKWGTTEQESTMPMLGDKYAESISSTRAIDIHKPSQIVWQYLVDLGADRRGFYSYDFIEKVVGCEFANNANEKIRELEVGRIISGDTSGKSQYGFKVIKVVQGQAAYLENWGGWLVQAINSNTTRLLIRTHEKKSNNVFTTIFNRVFDAAHYIMERRMMLGIKDLAEMNDTYTPTNDLKWLLGIFISGLAGIVLVIASKGYSKFILPTIFYTVWQIVLLIFNPLLIYGILLLLFISGIFFANHYLQTKIRN